MKLALVTTPPALASGIGDYTRHLLPELARRAQVALFVEDARAAGELLGIPLRPASALDPREHDQVVFQLGNEVAHAFMPRLLARTGGAVVLHDWVLFDLAFAAHPALARGGIEGALRAFLAGDADQARIYVECALAQRARRRRLRRERAPEGSGLLDGWHAPEPGGRWTADQARLRAAFPGERATGGASGPRRVRVALSTEPGRRVELACDGRSVAWTATPAAREAELALELDPASASPAAVVELASAPVFVSDDQRRHGDPRRLGAFVRRVVVESPHGARELDLRAPAAAPEPFPGFTAERFRLPLNRAVVRGADAFLVHSQFVRDRVVAARGAAAPVAVVRHGAEPRWSDEPREAARARLGLEPRPGAVLVTCFGGVQAHKRIAPLLRACALARRTLPGLRLALVGALDRESLDVPGLVRELGLEDVVILPGRVEEERAWTWIHAGDFAVQLRGPSTGGSSGGVFQSLALGRAVIASDLDEQRELPADCVARVAPGPAEVEELASAIVELATRPELRAGMEAAARRFVERECAWSRVAAAYIEHLSAFPRPRGARR